MLLQKCRLTTIECSLIFNTGFQKDKPEIQYHLWEKIEIELEANNDYENPYTDVEVWVDLKGPDFSERCYGFWDGENNWENNYEWPESYARYIRYIYFRYQGNIIFNSPIHLDSWKNGLTGDDWNRAANSLVDEYGWPVMRKAHITSGGETKTPTRHFQANPLPRCNISVIFYFPREIDTKTSLKQN